MVETTKKALVTGGAGFIGSHIAERLVALGYSVVVLDDFSTGKKENLKSITGSVSIIEGDIAEAHVVERAMEGVSVVFHQAAIASVPKTIENPARSHAVNVTGTVNVFEAARRVGAKVIYASSCAVFGNGEGVPKSEASVICPVSPYALHKFINEEYAEVYGATYGLQTVGLRYFNVFGPRQDPSSPYSGVISIFAQRALAGEPVTVFGDGRTTRDFVFIEDIVDANIRAAETETGVTEIFTIGTGIETSLQEVIQVLEGTTGNRLEVTYGPERQGDIRRSFADSNYARKVLAWEPKVSFQEGVRMLLNHLR